MQEIKSLLSGCFDRLQTLQIKPTLGNMEILTQTLYDLRTAYSKLNESEESRHESGRTTADTEGRNED